MVFYAKVGDSEVRHDFHDDGFAITGSHTILHQKLLIQPHTSDPLPKQSVDTLTLELFAASCKALRLFHE
jgi:hypothetical protein